MLWGVHTIIQRDMRTKELIRTMLFIIGDVFYHNKKSKIIYYHDFYDGKSYTDMATPLSLFKQHIEVAKKNGFKIVDKITKPVGELTVMLDDGFRGIWDCREFFFEQGIHPTIFIAKSLVGQEGYLTENEIKKLSAKGWNFQSHTVSHTSLNDFSMDQLDYELKESKRYLEEVIGKPVDEICAPQGKYSNWACEHAYRAGYDVFYSSTPGAYFERLTDFSFVITRNLCQSLTPFQFKLAINGGYQIFQRIYFKRRYKTLKTVKK